MSRHSTIVGGSSARRVMKCPGSVALAAKVPQRPSSSYADEGTLLHEVLAQMLSLDIPAEALLGKTYGSAVLTEDLIDEKIVPLMKLLDELDPDKSMEYVVEANVSFGDVLEGVFGSADIIGRRGKTAVVADWKTGQGIAVAAEESEQLLFYCAAALHTPDLKWVFDGAEDVELAIMQPGRPLSRWKTTFARVLEFERELTAAVKKSAQPNAPLALGDHCRFCPARAICPLMNGEVDRALKQQVKALDAAGLAAALDKVALLKAWMEDVEELGQFALSEGGKLPGWKLVNKRATRKWADDKIAVSTLLGIGLKVGELTETKMKSPAQIEALLKKQELGELPRDIVSAVSSGTTLAPESDPRPAAVQIGKQLKSALSRIQ